jgi:peptidoglycan hydrolase-like protein with peptidoglycan-binding domain
VRSPAARAARNDSALGNGRRIFLFAALTWSRRDAVGCAVGIFAVVAILINALFMQSGSHPAPILDSAGGRQAATEKTAPAAPRPRPAEAAPAKAAAAASAPQAAPAAAPAAAARTPGEIITDIQRELANRGYYDGTIDGLYGPRTDAAIHEFERTAGLRSSTEPNEALLAAVMRSPVAAAKAPAAPDPKTRVDSERPASSKRVSALQRALAEFGYGQIKPTGLIDAETRSAIEKFERERKLPVTGQANDRVMRELALMTGRPLEQ